MREPSDPQGDVDFDDFEARPPPAVRERGPHFEQPLLSVVGDAAVTLGDCYNLDVRATERADGGHDACLVPPVVRRLFPSDAHLDLDLRVCPSTVAPFHMHDPQPAGIAAMLCFDECHARNTSTAPPPEPTIDYDALTIASCTRLCFTDCTRPLAVSCSASCASANYSCFEACHADAVSCSIPMGPRDVRSFRADPNLAECSDAAADYRSCVGECNSRCHEALALSKRTPADDVDDWYNATCTPPLTLGVGLAGACMPACEANCSAYCNATVSAPLGPHLGYGIALANCTANCSAGCVDACFAPEALSAYAVGCAPPAEYNCTAACFGERCAPLATYCTVYDAEGILRAIDANCTLGDNITFTDYWVNHSFVEALNVS